MCGIAGIFGFEGQAELARVVAMTNMMRARGPDDEGFVIIVGDARGKCFFGADSSQEVRERLGPRARDASKINATGRVVLGHRRLSIVDLSPSGHQPMSDHNLRRWIVFNGEIYNFRELRLELQGLGHTFYSSSDTEVILAAYEQWGSACLLRFNGDFAFVIWDPDDRSLFCARDRLGVKPFYYVHTNGHFAFASDIKAILASGLHPAEPDRDGLYLALMFGMAPRPITAFRGIRALEQAHWMRVHHDGRIESARYWSIPIGTQDESMQLRDAESELSAVLRRAVCRRLEADVPVGTFMSGGIDSTTISAIAAQEHPGIQAFTLGFEDSAPELDEVMEAEATARMWPMRHVVERIDRNALPCDIETWIDGYEEPYYSLAANHVISSVVRRHGVKVVLNGLGGDELFGGYAYYRLPPWFGRVHLKGLATIGRNLVNPLGFRRLRMSLAASPDRVHTLAFARWSDRDLQTILKPSWHLPIPAEDYIHCLYAKGLKFHDNVEAFSYMDLMNYLGNHHVHRVDQFTMAVSVEGRFPFLDHEVVELAFKIPTKWKVSEHSQKFVLRQVAGDLIAPQCLAMKKKGFGLPLELYLRGPLARVMRDALSRLEGRGIVRAEALDDCRRGLVPCEQLWQMASLELWMQRFMDRSWGPSTSAEVLGAPK